MASTNLVTTLINRSVDIIKTEGVKGYVHAIRQYYQAYPPLRKNLSYYLKGKLAKDKLITKEIQGSTMYLNLDDFGLSKYLYLNGIREPECTKLMHQLLKPGMTIVEIGANIGYYALMEATHLGPTGKIYAIEPLPSNYDLLTKNVALNNYQDIIELHHLAISDKTGTTTLYVSDKHNLANMLNANADGAVEVPTQTLDEFMKDKHLPDLIRMDIEGYEYYILDGMKHTLQACQNCTMFIEVHPYQMYEKGLDYTKPLQQLFDAGFRPTYVVKEYGPQKEESFAYTQSPDEFYDFLKAHQLTPPENTHGFGLFLTKHSTK